MLLTIYQNVIQILGAYTPNGVMDSQSGTLTPFEGLASIDFGYVFSGIMLCIFIYGLVRIIGGLICK